MTLSAGLLSEKLHDHCLALISSAYRTEASSMTFRPALATVPSTPERSHQYEGLRIKWVVWSDVFSCLFVAVFAFFFLQLFLFCEKRKFMSVNAAVFIDLSLSLSPLSLSSLSLSLSLCLVLVRVGQWICKHRSKTHKRWKEVQVSQPYVQIALCTQYYILLSINRAIWTHLFCYRKCKK